MDVTGGGYSVDCLTEDSDIRNRGYIDTNAAFDDFESDDPEDTRR